MTIEYFAEFAGVGTGLIAISTFIWAIYRWLIERRHDQLQAYRLELSEFRSAVVLFEEGVSDLSAIQIGNLSAERLLLLSGAKSGREFKKFLQECDPVELFLGALVYGVSESSLQQSQISAVKQLKRTTGRQHENFPVSTSLIRVVSNFMGRFVEISSLAAMMKKVIDTDQFPEKLIESIEDDDTIGYLFSKTSDNYSQIVAIGSQQTTKPAKLTAEIVDILTGAYLNLSDYELLNVSKEEKLHRSASLAIDVDTFTAEIIELTDLLLPLLPEESRVALVDARTRLDASFDSD